MRGVSFVWSFVRKSLYEMYLSWRGTEKVKQLFQDSIQQAKQQKQAVSTPSFSLVSTEEALDIVFSDTVFKRIFSDNESVSSKLVQLAKFLEEKLHVSPEDRHALQLGIRLANAYKKVQPSSTPFLLLPNCFVLLATLSDEEKNTLVGLEEFQSDLEVPKDQDPVEVRLKHLEEHMQSQALQKNNSEAKDLKRLDASVKLLEIYRPFYLESLPSVAKFGCLVQCLFFPYLGQLAESTIHAHLETLFKECTPPGEDRKDFAEKNQAIEQVLLGPFKKYYSVLCRKEKNPQEIIRCLQEMFLYYELLGEFSPLDQEALFPGDPPVNLLALYQVLCEKDPTVKKKELILEGQTISITDVFVKDITRQALRINGKDLTAPTVDDFASLMLKMVSPQILYDLSCYLGQNHSRDSIFRELSTSLFYSGKHVNFSGVNTGLPRFVFEKEGSTCSLRTLLPVSYVEQENDAVYYLVEELHFFIVDKETEPSLQLQKRTHRKEGPFFLETFSEEQKEKLLTIHECRTR